MAGYSRRGLHGQTVDALGRRIVSGSIDPGATLDLTTLREDLGVSGTAMREALKVLAAKGLVDARQKRGTYVLPRSQWNLLDDDVVAWQMEAGIDYDLLHGLHEVRMIIEPAAASLAAERRTDDDLDRLDQALAGMADPDARTAVEADVAFHQTLLAATQNEYLTRMEVVIEVSLAGQAERDRLVNGSSPDDDIVPTHAAVLDAVRAGDAAAAGAAMHHVLAQATAHFHTLHPQTDPSRA